MIHAAGSRIRVIEDGGGDEAVLFVHGVGGWAENWTEAIERVAATGRRAIAFDLPGFGESTPVRGARYFDPEAPFYAAVVEAVRRALCLERPHLVGHSLGGGIVAVTAVVHPDAWRSITLVAPAGFGPDIPLFLRLLSVPLLGLLTWVPRPKFAGRAVTRSCFHDPSRVPEHLYSEADRFDRSYPETLRVMRAAATLRGVRSSLRQTWLSRARAYTGPVLVVWGGADGVMPAADLHTLRASYPQAELATIPSAGHLVMPERPDEFAGVLVPFLDRAGSRRGVPGAGGPSRMGGGVAHHER